MVPKNNNKNQRNPGARSRTGGRRRGKRNGVRRGPGQGRRPANGQRPTGSHIVRISPSACQWARALADPVSVDHVDIPSAPALRNRKIKTFVKGTFSTGTAAVGWIVADPFYAAVSDAACVYYTQATFAGTTIAYGSGGVAGTTFGQSNAPFTTAQIGAASDLGRYRVAAAGLRISYTGTALNKGGTAVGFSNPRHMTNVGSSYANLITERTAIQIPIDASTSGKWFNLPYKFVDSDDVDYLTTFPTLTPVASVNTDTSFHMAIMIQAPSTTPISFNFEFYVHHNYVGRNVGPLTDGHADPLGYSCVQAASATRDLLLFSSDAPDVVTGRVLAAAAKYAGEHTTHTRKATLEDVAHGAQAVGDVAKGVADTATGISVLLDLLGFL